MAFHSHGNFTFKVENRLMIIEGKGPWNLEAINRSAEDASKCHKELYGAKWGVLAIIHGDPIHTPPAAALLTDLVKVDIKNGRTASALILDDSNHPVFGRHHISQIYRDAGETFDFFHNIAEAKTWLENQLEQA